MRSAIRPLLILAPLLALAAAEPALDRAAVLAQMGAAHDSELRAVHAGRETLLTAARVQVPAGTLLVAKPAARAQPRTLEAEALHRLPDAVRGAAVDGAVLPVPVAVTPSAGGAAAPRALQALVLIDRPLMRDPDTGRFTAHIRIGLRDPADQAATGMLPEPVPVTIGAEVDEIVPPQVELRAINRDFVGIALFASAPPPSVQLRVLGPLAGGEPLTLTVVTPALSVSPHEIAAFGLGRATVTVQRPDHAPGRVGLEVEHGTLTATTIECDGSGSGATELRSGNRVGDDTVRAGAGLPRVEAFRVRYVWPVAYTVATLLGAALGALATLAIHRRSTATDQRPAGWTAVEAIVAGILGGLAPPLGLQLLPFAVPESSAAAAGLLCALLAGIVLPLTGWRRLIGS